MATVLITNRMANLNISLVDWERVKDEYGKKIEFTVTGEDSGAFESLIDNCDWNDETHHRNIYEDRWRVDRSLTALEAIERETNVGVDKSVLIPDESRVSLEIPRGDLWIRIKEMPSEVEDILSSDLSYTKEYWDDSQNELKEYSEDVIFDEGIPVGMKNRVEERLEELGVEYLFVDYRNDPDWKQVDFGWDFPHNLRTYQKEGLSRMLRGSCVMQWPTGAGKTIAALRCVHELGMPTLIIVHQLDLFEQWIDEIQSVLGVQPGVIHEDTLDIRNITVAMIPSLHNRIKENPNFYLEDFDVMIGDEIHHMKADTWFEVAMHVNAHYRYGLSATVDSLFTGEKRVKVIATVGPNDITISPEYLIEEGHLAEPEFEWKYPKRIDGNFDNWQTAYREGIVENSDRNELVAETFDQLIESNRRTLVDVKQIDHGERLISKIESGLQCEWWDPNSTPASDYHAIDFDPDNCSEWPIPVVHDGKRVYGYNATGDMQLAIEMAINKHDNPVFWVYGEDDSEIRETILHNFRTGDVSGVVSTLLREGVNIPELDAVILAGGGKSATQLIQTVGRALRPKGHDTAKIIDFKDVGPYIENHTEERYKAMKDYYGKFCDSAPVGI